MQKGLYAIKDMLVGFAAPVVEDNDEVALRNFDYAINTNKLISMNANNFALFKLGVIDSNTGVIDVSNCPVMIVDAASRVRKEIIKDGE